MSDMLDELVGMNQSKQIYRQAKSPSCKIQKRPRRRKIFR